MESVRLELMDADGHVVEVSPEKVAWEDGGRCATLDGARFMAYASFDTTHAYCTQATPGARALLRVALPLPLGATLFPAPILWASEHGLGAYYGKRGAHEAASCVALDAVTPSVDDAASEQSGDEGEGGEHSDMEEDIAASELDGEDDEEQMGDEDEDEEMDGEEEEDLSRNEQTQKVRQGSSLAPAVAM